MDFDKMKDELKGQMSEKVKEELMQKVDEVKADVAKKFGNFGGQTENKSEASTSPAEFNQTSPLQPGSRLESQRQAENIEEERGKEQGTAAVPDSDSGEDSGEVEKEVA
ncbi:MAG: hypothetical protein NVS1B11_33520 [Terriglobales bacterium]